MNDQTTGLVSAVVGALLVALRMWTRMQKQQGRLEVEVERLRAQLREVEAFVGCDWLEQSKSLVDALRRREAHLMAVGYANRPAMGKGLIGRDDETDTD